MLEPDVTPSHLGVTRGDFSPMIHITDNSPIDEIHGSPHADD
jgi:hypothetical protein